MVKRRWMPGGFLAALAVLLGANQVLAADLDNLEEHFEGLPGLTVSLYQDEQPVGSPVTTDPHGRFVFESLAAGEYELVVENADATLTLSFPLAVPTSDPPVPSDLEGYVYGRSDLAVGYMVKARLFAGDLSITRVRLSPSKWNLGSTEGTIKVFTYGEGLDAISEVTLTTKVASISTTEIVLEPGTGRAVASYPRADVFARLVPEEAKDGARLRVEVKIEAAGSAPQIYNREVVILR